MKFGLKDSTVQAICDLLVTFPQVEKAVLYGSRAKGNYRTGSDVDLTLFGEDGLTTDVLYRIVDRIDDLNLPYSFDLSIFRDISDPDVVDHIRRVGVVFYHRSQQSQTA